MATLVTGGAGFIGSHMALALLDRGEDVVIVDNLASGVRACIPSGAHFLEADVGDQALMGEILKQHGIEAIVHFAASSVVPDSVKTPLTYYKNNTINTHALISAAVSSGVKRFVLSSTAAVYGMPGADLVGEDLTPDPISPYGASKLMAERIAQDAFTAHGLPIAILRYFNVAGADPLGRSGQSTPNATHLIKVCMEVAAGAREAIEIFGDDYPTPDGTGIRDFVHVTDLIDAHVAALNRLQTRSERLLYNCGYGKGYSVRQVIDAVARISGKPIKVKISPRREPDLAKVVADASAIRRDLDWRPRYDDLDTIIAHAYAWETRAQRAM